MPLLEEVDEGAEESSSGGAESLKAEHRRRRASKARKKKRTEEVREGGRERGTEARNKRWNIRYGGLQDSACCSNPSVLRGVLMAALPW